jgi:hypothetical protein
VILSQVATVGGRLNDCENFKKTLVGVQWYSVHVSQTAIWYTVFGLSFLHVSCKDVGEGISL